VPIPNLDTFRRHLKTAYSNSLSKPPNAYLLMPQICLLLTIMRVYKQYIFIYLFKYFATIPSVL